MADTGYERYLRTDELLALLGTMNPWDYHAVRRVLGNGSGMDSPGYRKILAGVGALRHAFETLLEREGVDLETVYVEAGPRPALFRLAEGLINYDDALRRFQYAHPRIVQRSIGPGVFGTGGTAVRDLERRLGRSLMPALWDVRDRLTARADTGD